MIHFKIQNIEINRKSRLLHSLKMHLEKHSCKWRILISSNFVTVFRRPSKTTQVSHIQVFFLFKMYRVMKVKMCVYF